MDSKGSVKDVLRTSAEDDVEKACGSCRDVQDFAIQYSIPFSRTLLNMEMELVAAMSYGRVARLPKPYIVYGFINLFGEKDGK